MDNLALSVSKSITEFLEQNEKRYINQSTEQDRQKISIEQLLARVEALENKCEDLRNQNISLLAELEAVNKRETELNKSIISINTDQERMQKSVTKCEEWVQFAPAMAENTVAQDEIKKEINDLKALTERQAKDLHDMYQNQADLEESLKRQQKQISKTSATANQAIAAACKTRSSPSHNGERISVRSPSTSSFFSSNFHNNQYQTHSNTPFRHNTHQYFQNHTQKDDLQGSYDPYHEMSEISEMSEDAESLIHNVNLLNNYMSRSRERNGASSDD